MKKNTTTKKTMKIPFAISLSKKGEGSRKPTVQTSTVLITGILITCLTLSVVSGFIDLVFFSNLSKSLYEMFGWIAIPAGALMSLMSVGFTLGKFFCGMQLGAINELQTRLRGAGYVWAKNLDKLKLRWNIIHKFLIGVSIITSISLSVVSIGSGITRNANTLKQIDSFIEQGTRYSELVNTANNTQLTTIVKKASDTSEEDSIKYAESETLKVWPLIESYQEERSSFVNNGYEVGGIEEIEWKGNRIIPSDYWDDKNTKLNASISKYGLKAGSAAMKYNEQSVMATIKQNYLSNHTVKSTDEVNKQMGELKDSTLEEASAWITTLNSIGFTKNIRLKYVDEKGKEKYKWETVPVVFDTDPNKSTKVLVDTALTQLKAFRVDVENDSGDIGSSSKIFMLIGSWFDNAKAKQTSNVEEALTLKVSTGMGSTEIMMMILIMIFGIVQEFLIALFTPKSLIDRKMLSRFNAYFDMQEFKSYELNKFMLTTYKDYLDLGIINQKDFEEKAKKCVSLMEESVDDIIKKYSKKGVEKLSVSPSFEKEYNELKESFNKQFEENNLLKDENRNLQMDLEDAGNRINILNNQLSSLKPKVTERVIKPKVEEPVKESVEETVEEEGFSSEVTDKINKLHSLLEDDD